MFNNSPRIILLVTATGLLVIAARLHQKKVIVDVATQLTEDTVAAMDRSVIRCS